MKFFLFFFLFIASCLCIQILDYGNDKTSADKLMCFITAPSSISFDSLRVKMLYGTSTVKSIMVTDSGVYSTPAPITVRNGDVIPLTLYPKSRITFTTYKANVKCVSVLASPEPNSLLSYDFIPHTAQNIPNPLYWSVNLKCSIKSTDATDVMVGRMVSGTGSVNGQTVTASGVSFTVTNGVAFTITASAGAVVSITNQGSSSVHADCDLASSEEESNSMFLNGTLPQDNENVIHPLGWTGQKTLLYNFPPKLAVTMSNPSTTSSPIKLVCTFTSLEFFPVSFYAKLVSGRASMDGRELSAFGFSAFLVQTGAVYTYIIAAKSSIVIYNMGGKYNIHGSCEYYY